MTLNEKVLVYANVKVKPGISLMKLIQTFRFRGKCEVDVNRPWLHFGHIQPDICVILLISFFCLQDTFRKCSEIL